MQRVMARTLGMGAQLGLGQTDDKAARAQADENFVADRIAPAAERFAVDRDFESGACGRNLGNGMDMIAAFDPQIGAAARISSETSCSFRSIS